MREIWNSVLEFMRTFGAMTLFFVQLLRYSPPTLFKRFDLVAYQVFNAGALSIVIIMVCGLFVGGVLGLQAFANLERFNAEEATGILAGFALVKEIGVRPTLLDCKESKASRRARINRTTNLKIESTMTMNRQREPSSLGQRPRAKP